MYANNRNLTMLLNTEVLAVNDAKDGE